MVLKLGPTLKFPSKLQNHALHNPTLSESLCNFRSKVRDFIAHTWLNPERETELRSLAGFNACFDLIHTTNSAFTKLVVEINYPMTQWGPKLTEDYLTYTLSLMELLNAISSSVSRLSRSMLSLTLFQTSSSITQEKLVEDLKFERGLKVKEKVGCDQESVLLQAMIVLKKIGFLALGFVVSGLCGDAKPYMDVRRFSGGFDDSMTKDLESRLGEAVEGIMGEVKEVKNVCTAETEDELKRRLKVLQNSVRNIEKQSNDLFSQALSARNKLLDNLRLSG